MAIAKTSEPFLNSKSNGNHGGLGRGVGSTLSLQMNLRQDRSWRGGGRCATGPYPYDEALS